MTTLAVRTRLSLNWWLIKRQDFKKKKRKKERKKREKKRRRRKSDLLHPPLHMCEKNNSEFQDCKWIFFSRTHASQRRYERSLHNNWHQGRPSAVSENTSCTWLMKSFAGNRLYGITTQATFLPSKERKKYWRK